MFPIVLDLKRIPVFVIGEGELLSKRKAQLDEYGAAHVYICSPDHWLNAEASHYWDNSQIVMVAGLERALAEEIAQQARHQKKLVNVEDITDLCDFYFTANVKRGDLLIAVSTGGASPTLAKRVRDAIAELFGTEWAERTQLLADLRNRLKASGVGMKDIIAKTDHYLAEKKWLLSSPSPLRGEGGVGVKSLLGINGDITPSLTLPPQGGGDKKGEAA